MDRTIRAATRKSRWSWYSYDFGNSAYAAVILLAVYSTYFKNVVVGGAQGTRLWGVSVGIAAIIVALVSPVLGTIADFTRSKKRFLIAFTAISVVFTGLLFFVGEGDVFTGMLFFIIAEIGYRGAQVFYDALLTDVSTPDTVGSVSGKGWAVGMVGGIVTLLIVLLPIRLVGNQVTHFAFLVTAVLYLLFSIPTFLWVVERPSSEQIPHGKSTINVAFSKLAQTFRSIRDYREFVKYMAAFLIYNDGIMMLLDFAAIVGATLFGMEQTQLIMFVILIHISGAIGSLYFGRISDRRSSKEAILISLVILIASVAGLYAVDGIVWFYVIGLLAGFSLSGAQAVSRTMVSQLAPAAKTAEFYGFLSVAGRTSTFVGPLVFGAVSYRAHNWYVGQGLDAVAAERYGLLWAVGSIIGFLIIGMLVLLLVKRISAKDLKAPVQERG
jgi:UMF1 family MFS transporter